MENENEIYAFSNERTLNYVIEAVRRVFGRDLTSIAEQNYPIGQVFAEIVELRDDTSGKQATAIQVEWNYATRAFVTKSGGWMWDSDASQEDMITTTDIFCDKTLEVGEVVEVIRLAGVEVDENEDQWFARKSASESGGQNYQVTIVSGSGDEYDVTVLEGDPATAEDTKNGTLILSYAIDNDLTVGMQLMATCYRLNTDPVTYNCYIFETIYNLVD
jgi:hypothetical protein